MPTTARGLWYADASASANPISISTSEVNAAQTAMDNLALSESVPRFASATARDTAFTNWTTATGLPLVTGMQCSVAGIPQIYQDAVQRNTAGWYMLSDTPMMELAFSGASFNYSALTWYAIPQLGVTDSNTPSGGPHYTAVANGVTVNQAGTYLVEAFCLWVTSAAVGFRYLTVNTSAGNAASAATGNSRQSLPAFANMDKSHTLVREMKATAGQVISAYAYTTVTDLVQNATLRVRRVA